MRREWLWLEDQASTVADFGASFRHYLKVRTFRRANDLLRFLEKCRERSPADLSRFGFILDVMLIGTPMIMVPGTWWGRTMPVKRMTARGGDAGLVLYETLFCVPGRDTAFPVSPLPPVAFLSVIPLEESKLNERFETLRRTWAKVKGCPLEEAQVAWFFKDRPEEKGRIQRELLGWEES